MRDRWRRFSDRQMARRMTSDDGRPSGGLRRGVLLGWLAAAVAIAVFALIVGRPGGDGALASPTPTPGATPDAITFGAQLNPVTGEVIDPVDTFGIEDGFAYSFVPGDPVQSETVTVEVLRVDGDRLQRSHAGQLEAGPIIGEQITARAMLDTHGPGEFVMRIYVTPDEVLGEGRFRLVDGPPTTDGQ